MKHLVTWLACFAMLSATKAQTHPAIVNHIISQLRIFPQEKTYVHTDAADYAPGDRIWFKVYVVNALSHEPVDNSLYTYVELISPDESLTAKAKVLCRDGIYAGYIDIPASATSGCYYIRAYTHLSMNMADYGSICPIFVGGGKQPKQDKRTAKEPATGSINDERLLFTRNDSHVMVTTNIAEDSLLLLAHCRAFPFALVPIGRNRPVIFHCDSIPEGVISLLLLNNQQEILAERLFYSNNKREQCMLQIIPKQPSFAPNEQIELLLKATDLHEGEHIDISVSVTGTIQQHRHRPSSIVAHLLLDTDKPGGILFPETLIEDTWQADSALSNCKWRRYDFSEVFKGNYTAPAFPCETTHAVTGRVQTLMRKKPVAGASVSLISPQAGCFAIDTTDTSGCFSFKGLDFPEGTQYVLRASNAKGNEHVELTIEEQDRPDFHLPHSSKTINQELFSTTADSLTGTFSDAIMLDNLDVIGTRRNSASKGNVFAEIADFSFGLHKIEELGATCLHELIRHIPGVRLHQNRCYIRSASSIYKDSPATIAIDGIIVADEYDLDNIQMQDVARVDVFKTGSTVIWGSAGGNGVISITTKLGSYGEPRAEVMKQKSISPMGYQRPSSFFSQSGLRKTLYWNPSVTTDTISVNGADSQGKCHVVVEGVTSEGRLIHQELDINIIP